MKGQWRHRDGYGHFFPWNSGKPLKREAPNGGLSPQTEIGKEGGGKGGYLGEREIIGQVRAMCSDRVGCFRTH